MSKIKRVRKHTEQLLGFEEPRQEEIFRLEWATPAMAGVLIRNYVKSTLPLCRIKNNSPSSPISYPRMGKTIGSLPPSRPLQSPCPLSQRLTPNITLISTYPPPFPAPVPPVIPKTQALYPPFRNLKQNDQTPAQPQRLHAYHLHLIPPSFAPHTLTRT